MAKSLYTLPWIPSQPLILLVVVYHPKADIAIITQPCTVDQHPSEENEKSYGATVPKDMGKSIHG